MYVVSIFVLQTANTDTELPTTANTAAESQAVLMEPRRLLGPIYIYI